MKKQILKYKITLIEDMLGTTPKSKEIFTDHIQNKAVEKNLLTQEQVDEELKSVGDLEEKGWTGFMSDEKGLFMFNYAFKGFLKAAGNVLKEQLKIKALKNKIGDFVFVYPRKIYFGKKEPDGVVERSLRAETMQGPRVCLAKSDKLDAGTIFAIEIHLIEHKEITKETIEEIMQYGQLKGLLQFRNGGYGAFVFEEIK